MITRKSPWRLAVREDPCFSAFLSNEEHLREFFPISRSANALLRKILTYEPSERITLSALRKEIIALDTFFMTNDEVARASKAVRDAAEYCGHHVQPVKSLLAPQSDDLQATTEASSANISGGPVTPASCAVDLETYLPQLELKLAGLESHPQAYYGKIASSCSTGIGVLDGSACSGFPVCCSANDEVRCQVDYTSRLWG